MKPKLRMMYPHIGQAKQLLEFTVDLLFRCVMDDADLSGSPLFEKTTGYKNPINKIYRKEKQPSDQHYKFVVLKKKHAVISFIILAIIMLTNIVTPCLGAENGISWTEDELAFMERHP